MWIDGLRDEVTSLGYDVTSALRGWRALSVKVDANETLFLFRLRVAVTYCLGGARTEVDMAVKPIPEGYHSITPYLIIKGAAAAIDYYKKVFGAKERMR